MTTAAVAEMEARHVWFRELDAEHRSWITLVARAGIDGFVTWFAEPDLRRPEPPRTCSARLRGSWPAGSRLHQTVELVRTTIDVVETQIDEVMPRADRPILHAAIVAYSREVAFAAAEIYARAAELRGAWDERLEASVVDAVLRGETDDTVLSRASTLGWPSTARRRGGGGRGAGHRRPQRRRRRGARVDPATGRDRRVWTCWGRCRATG